MLFVAFTFALRISATQAIVCCWKAGSSCETDGYPAKRVMGIKTASLDQCDKACKGASTQGGCCWYRQSDNYCQYSERVVEHDDYSGNDISSAMCFSANDMSSAMCPQLECQDNLPIPGSNRWWTCMFANMHAVGSHCQCNTGFQAGSRRRCHMCQAPNTTSPPTLQARGVSDGYKGPLVQISSAPSWASASPLFFAGLGGGVAGAMLMTMMLGGLYSRMSVRQPALLA